MWSWTLQHLQLLSFIKTIVKTSIISPNIHFWLQTSFISNCFVVMVVFLYLTTTIYSVGYLYFEHDQRKFRFHFITLLAVLTTICLAYSKNLFTAFVFYDLLSVFTYLLVAHHKDQNSESHAFIYLSYLIIPSMVLLLPAIIYIYNIADHTSFVEGGILSKIPISKQMVNILFLMTIYGISKTALYPLHKWLIHAMVAPSPVSALLHAVLVVKGGLFLLYKVINETFGVEFLSENIYRIYGTPWPVYVAGYGIIMAAISATASENIKQRLAYSTISQIGYISMCLFCFTKEAVFAAQMHFLAHSFAKISLFYYAGYLLIRYHVRNVSELKIRRNRVNIILSISWLVPILSLFAVPPTFGLYSKHIMIDSLIQQNNNIAFLLVLFFGLILSVFYLFPLIYHLISFDNTRNKQNSIDIKEIFYYACMYIPVIVIACAIIFGFYITLK